MICFGHCLGNNKRTTNIKNCSWGLYFFVWKFYVSQVLLYVSKSHIINSIHVDLIIFFIHKYTFTCMYFWSMNPLREVLRSFAEKILCWTSVTTCKRLRSFSTLAVSLLASLSEMYGNSDLIHLLISLPCLLFIYLCMCSYALLAKYRMRI